jgi:excisionase family DNA binding protein
MGLDNLPDVITPKQLSEFLQISDQTIKRAIKDGRLKAFKIGREWRIEKESAIKWTQEGGNYGKESRC